MDHFVGVKGHEAGYCCDAKINNIALLYLKFGFESCDDIKKETKVIICSKSSEWRHSTGCFRMYNDELLL